MAEIATIARPYAEALFQVAKSQDLAAWGQQLDALAQVAQDADLRQFADHPKVQPDQVFAVVAAAAKIELAVGVQNFLRTLIENGRLAALPAIAAQYQALANAASGIFEARIYSAFDIGAEQLVELKAVLEKRFGRKLDTHVQIEPGLIGGVRVVVGDEVLDTSVKARLERMKLALTA